MAKIKLTKKTATKAKAPAKVTKVMQIVDEGMAQEAQVEVTAISGPAPATVVVAFQLAGESPKYWDILVNDKKEYVLKESVKQFNMDEGMITLTVPRAYASRRKWLEAV